MQNASLFFALAFAAALNPFLGSSMAFAQAQAKVEATYPSRPMRVIVAYSPGGGVDLVSRSVAQKLSASFGQPVVVENRPGANGMIGAQAAARSLPDGYTLVVLDRGTLTINTNLYKDIAYSPVKDFAYVGVSWDLPFILTINAELPIQTLEEFVKYAKTKPGAINFATFGAGSLIHLNFEQLSASFGIAMTHVPYKGSVRAATAVVNGEAGTFMSAYQGVGGFIRSGHLRALAVGRLSRLPALPDVPTMGELGAGDDILAPGYFTFTVAAGTPRAIVMKLHSEMERASAMPDLEKYLSNAGMETRSFTPEQFAEGVARDIERFRKLVQTAGIPQF